MGVLEDFVVDRAGPTLADGWEPDLPFHQRVARAVIRITIGADLVTITLQPGAVVAESSAARVNLQRADQRLALTVPVRHRPGALILTMDVIEFCAFARAIGAKPGALLAKIDAKLPAEL